MPGPGRRLITARANDAVGGMGLTIFRLFIHPVIWQVIMLLFRQFLRNVGERRGRERGRAAPAESRLNRVLPGRHALAWKGRRPTPGCGWAIKRDAPGPPAQGTSRT